MPRPKIIYIAGNGHSGSTLVDMIIGSNKDFFSGGELINICRPGIDEEYCSCRRKIKECSFWQNVYQRWEGTRNITLEEYQRLRFTYDRNKALVKVLLNLVSSLSSFREYVNATQKLFEAIHEESKAEWIIDSSKNPVRILLLMQFSELRVIHLCRNFKGVLNSAKQFHEKNIEEGYEIEISPRRTIKSFVDWLLNNFLTEIFAKFVKSIKLSYSELNQLSEQLKRIDIDVSISDTKDISADHMLAGNVIRLKKNISFDPKLGQSYYRLSIKQMNFAIIIDKIFWFWT